MDLPLQSLKQFADDPGHTVVETFLLFSYKISKKGGNWQSPGCYLQCPEKEANDGDAKDSFADTS